MAVVMACGRAKRTSYRKADGTTPTRRESADNGHAPFAGRLASIDNPRLAIAFLNR